MWTTYDSVGLPVIGPGPAYQLVSVAYVQQGTTSYMAPSGTRALRIMAVGAGGGGGGVLDAATNSGAGGGGGGGAYSEKWLVNPLFTAYAVAVGAFGAGGAAGANNGSAGGDTTFAATVVIAKGGSGGAADTTAIGPRVGSIGAAGGDRASGGGELLVSGCKGETSIILSATMAVSGGGGDSRYGAGALGRKTQGDGGAGGALRRRGRGWVKSLERRESSRRQRRERHFDY